MGETLDLIKFLTQVVRIEVFHEGISNLKLNKILN